MNQPLTDDALEIDSQNEHTLKSTVDVQNSSNFSTPLYFCLDCRGESFDNANDLEKHLIDQHIKDAQVLLQRLTDATIQRLNQTRGRQRKGAFARKRSHSYLVPRVKGGKKGSLKLKLKVSGNRETPSFEVVPVQKVLVGPGDLYPLNGGDFSEVKTENFLTAVEWEKSLEGPSEQPEVASSGERTLNEELSSYEKENSLDSNKSNEDLPGDDIVNDEILENSKDSENDDLLTIDKEELDIPPSPAPTPAATPLPNLPSPSTPPDPESDASPLGISSDPVSENLNSPSNDQLDSEYLSQDSDTEFSQSPNMVEINNSAVADVRSPAFPTTSSPATPGQPTPPSEQQTSQSADDDENSESRDLSNAEELHCDDSSNGATSNNFVWTDVSGNDTDIGGDESNSQPLEERDPLLLNDPSTSSADQGGNLQGSPNSGSIDGSDQSILRGFLSDHPDRSPASVTGVSGLESFGLGSEYISLERLGDNAVICDVCGERAADQNALQDHKFRAGHFKCSQPECGGVIFTTAEEFMSHQQNIHGNQQYSQQNILNQSQTILNQQSAPVQQLVQQVQRLPVPQMSMQSLNKNQPPHSSAMPQQMSSNMASLIPSQQAQYQAAVCRPPPLYPAPAPSMMQQQHSAPPPYPGPQHVMFPQPYPPHGQSFANSPRQPMQMQPRPYSAMMQQMNQNTMRHQAPRVQVTNVQQRGLPAQNVGSPGGSSPGKRPIQNAPTSPANKQRRLDMLIPDRHDDADCHVIAMQKRTESGPLITGVQGSSPAGQPPSSRQSSQADSTINLTDSITLSVRGQNVNTVNGGKSRNDANSVASLLATRGITVTPAGASGRGNANQVQGQSPQTQHRQVSNRQPATSIPAPPPQPPPQPVTTLNLNSAISIIPTASVRTPPKPQQLQLQQSQQPGGNFAVPQGRSANRPQQQAQVERPPRPPTVDLTGDGPPLPPALNPMGGRGRGRGRGGMLGRNVCQLCDKPFPTLDALNQHMVTHRPGKLPFRCNMCTAQYPTQQGLLQHRQTYHKECPSQMNSELVLPVVDLKQPATLNRLSSLGVRHYIPLSQLSNQSGGVLGLPLVVLEGGRIPSANLSALGAATILTLGPLRNIPR